MKIDTLLTQVGRESALHSNSVSPPIVRTSTTLFASLADYRDAQRRQIFDAPRYGRSGTQTVFELQRAMATLAGTESCIATASGLAAIVAVLDAHAGPGRHILVSAGVYGLTRVYCDQVLQSSGTQVEYFQHNTDITPLLRETTSLVFIETPASLTMEMLDVKAVCSAAHAQGIPVASDSSWGTPIYFDAHQLGVDISIHAATKFINGHSDLLLGLMTGAEKSLAVVRNRCDRNGTHAAVDACWMALRGLRTLAIRMERHQKSALQVATWLEKHDAVQRVLFPALRSDPGYCLWKNQFTGAGGPFTFQVPPCREEVFERAIDGLKLFGLGTSWGGFESLVMPAVPHHLRGQTQSDAMPRLVRIHVGLENAADLCDDLDKAFKHLSQC